MINRWEKLGLLYSCDGLHPNLMSHAANPLPIHMYDDVYRIFFSARDKTQRSSIGGVDIDIVQRKVILEHHTPFFSFGAPDSFYSHGVSIGNTYIVDGITYMLFMGWRIPKRGHWYGELGRLIVNSDLSLQLDSDKPFMALDDIDPISLSYPWVMYDDGMYRMWYGSTVYWDAGNNEMLHVIKYAESEDGHSWLKKDHQIPHQIGAYQAFSRPTVIKTKHSYQIWFSCRSGDGSTYRIGSTTSSDGYTWNPEIRLDAIKLSKNEWDSEMVEYPFVLDHTDRRYMFYNGNGFGRSGFGIAVSSN